MSQHIERLTAADFEDAMDFLDLVFGAHRPHDFENLLPVRYRPTDELMSCHYAIRERGKIRAIVGMYPIRWLVGGSTFSVAGIGAVSTHRKSRRAGHMIALMEHCGTLMREQGVQLSWLGGQRQRYQHFGYERCGQADCFSLNASNLRHCFDDEPGIGFEPLRQDDVERVRRAIGLHDAQPVHCERAPERFHAYLLDWQNRPHAALDAGGRMVGYLVASAKGDRVAELVAESDETAVRMLRAWTASRGEGEVSVELPAWRVGLLRALGTWCEQVVVRPTGNWRILDWAGVIGALLGLRARSAPLPQGSVSLAIEGYGTLELGVDGERSSCVRSTAGAALTLDALTATRVLCGPLPPSRVIALPREAALLDHWCPLPLWLPGQDGV
jgi:predicted acetyltransferase